MSQMQFPPEGTPSRRELRFQVGADTDNTGRTDIYVCADDLLTYMGWLIEADPKYPLSAFEESIKSVTAVKREQLDRRPS